MGTVDDVARLKAAYQQWHASKGGRTAVGEVHGLHDTAALLGAATPGRARPDP